MRGTGWFSRMRTANSSKDAAAMKEAGMRPSSTRDQSSYTLDSRGVALPRSHL